VLVLGVSRAAALPGSGSRRGVYAVLLRVSAAAGRWSC